VSAEAKRNAEEQLKELGQGHSGGADIDTRDESHDTRVLAGYKAALHSAS
jgi:hypothetical protein